MNLCEYSSTDQSIFLLSHCSRQEVVLHGKERGSGSCGDAKLVVDVLNMVVNGTLGEREHGSNLAIRIASRDQPQHP